MNSTALLRLLLLCCALALAACSAGPRKRVFPPEVRVQELQRGADGAWQVQWRVSNFSNVPMRLATLDLQLRLDDGAWLPVPTTAEVLIAANSVELLAARLDLADEQRRHLDGLTPSDRVRYALRGTARFSEPSGRFDLDYSSALSPAPGLPGVLR